MQTDRHSGLEWQALLRIVLVATVCLPAAGQTCAPGGVNVVVRDSQQSPVFDAMVRVAGENTEQAPRPTSAQGIAEFQQVPCGTWNVIASKTGFEDSRAIAVITGSGHVEVSLILNPGINRSSLDVTDAAPAPVEQTASQDYKLKPAEVKILPNKPASVADALPLVPGIIRTPDGELKLDGSGEQRSSLVVNQSDVTDPATGRFGQTVPLDSIQSMNVLSTPFLAQYGRFTQTVVAVETRRGGDKFHADLNDPFPDFRIRSYKMRGIRNETPRASIGGPLIKDRLYFITSLLYFLDKSPNRTLPFPFNESKRERINSFTQIDYIASQRQVITFSYHFAPEHINFVNPEFFNPQKVTPSYAQRNYIVTLAHHYGIFDGTLDTSLSIQRFHTFIGSQGKEEMFLTPEGNLGNYFGVSTRDAWRREWLELWSPAPVRGAGVHQLKFGTSLTVANNRGHYSYRPVNILSQTGALLERIDFSTPLPFARADLEFTGYAQDHWTITPKIAVDYGLRLEHQRLADSLRIAPRAGFAYTPWANGRTVFRTGFGQFYDHIPLNVYTFGRYPNRTVTDYAPDGTPLNAPIKFFNTIGSVNGPRSFLVRGERVAGDFSPRGVTWNAQMEHSFSRLLRLRAVYTDNRSVGLMILEPDKLGTTNEIVLNGNGESRYRQLEITSRLQLEGDQQLVFSYVRSRAEGRQNGFDSFVGNFSIPLIRQDVYSNLAGDLPNRFLMWGNLNLPFQFRMMPLVEFRNGFPWAALNERQQYAGIPNSDKTRYANFFSGDARVSRDFKMSSKYTVRLSLTGYNMTNHFNALAVHNNIADPRYGVYFGNFRRRYRFDFDFLF
jgi:hypothetical protein